MAKKKVQIPFVEWADRREYIVYCSRTFQKQGVFNETVGEWLTLDIQFHEPHEFTDTLEIIEGHRGRSAAQVELKSTTKNWYYIMFFGGFLKAMKKLEVKDGKFTGTFRHVQRGQNYGIELVDG